jgi:biopolymer transport protein ExbD
VLIFLMLSTTYSKFTELQVSLPVANADKPRENPKEIIISIASDGRYAVDRKAIEGRSVDTLASAITAAAQGSKDAIIIISADATAAHQAVITVMDAARRAGMVRLTFAAQNGQSAGS